MGIKIIWYLPFLSLLSHHRIAAFEVQYTIQPTFHERLDMDFMGATDRKRIILLAEEVVIDTRLKQRQLFSVKSQFNYRLAFELGLVMGKIREKYKRMNDIYIEMTDRFRGRTWHKTPGVWAPKSLHYVVAMETIKLLEMEIDNMIHILEKIPKKAFVHEYELLRDFIGGDELGLTSMPFNTDDPPPTLANNMPILLREGTALKSVTESPIMKSHTTSRNTKSFKNEKDLKAYYRDQYNENNGRGKSKRNDNWLDQYYGFA